MDILLYVSSVKRFLRSEDICQYVLTKAETNHTVIVIIMFKDMLLKTTLCDMPQVHTYWDIHIQYEHLVF